MLCGVRPFGRIQDNPVFQDAHGVEEEDKWYVFMIDVLPVLKRSIKPRNEWTNTIFFIDSLSGDMTQTGIRIDETVV